MEKSQYDEMIRVNHAGEYGATRIYAGQLFVLGEDATIKHMAEQEQQHLNAFHRLVIEHRVRPSVLQPLWYVGGFAMGALTACFGRNVAHACTAAVETIIDRHYKDQLKILVGDHALGFETFDNNGGQSYDDAMQNAEVRSTQELELVELIKKCHTDECEHQKIALDEAGVDLAKEYPILTSVIMKITKTAVEIAKKI